MRAILILLMITLTAAAAVPQANETELILKLLLRDIPAADLTDEERENVSTDRGANDAAMTDSDNGAERPAGQCRRSCIGDGEFLDDLCERYVRADAPRSRAVCYTRVDERRVQCLASCDG